VLPARSGPGWEVERDNPREKDSERKGNGERRKEMEKKQPDHAGRSIASADAVGKACGCVVP
jgi:hypothetical protein